MVVMYFVMFDLCFDVFGDCFFGCSKDGCLYLFVVDINFGEFFFFGWFVEIV